MSSITNNLTSNDGIDSIDASTCLAVDENLNEALVSCEWAGQGLVTILGWALLLSVSWIIMIQSPLYLSIFRDYASTTSSCFALRQRSALAISC